MQNDKLGVEVGPSENFKLYIHLINRETQEVQTRIADAEGQLTIGQCVTILQEKIKLPMTAIDYKLKPEGVNYGDGVKVKNFCSKAQQDLYIFYNPVKPMIIEQKGQIKYDSITKYSFIDDKKAVKVYLDLQGIGELPNNKIYSRFLDRSLQVKIHDYKGKNWIFAVPKTHCPIKVKESKVIQKKDKLIISIGKMAESDNWFSLYKVKMIGQKEES